VCLMYSFSASLPASRDWICTNCLRGSFW
jgi:hypothetical protein